MKDYKKILEGVVNIINTTEKSDIGFANICAYIGDNCPELKESEDERIRKELLNYLYDVHDDDEERARWIAWLEKQGEHANFLSKIQVGDKVTRNEDGVLVNLSQLNRVAKPADKVEPKFKVGDWVVTKYGKVNQVKTVSDDGDAYDLDDNTYFSGSWKDMYHLWTIQDAKAGDLLADDYGIYIFDRFNEYDEKCFLCMGAYQHSQKVYENEHMLCSVEVHPATKEQRDTLMKAMTDAGYTFDFERKELKKIEQKPVEPQQDMLSQEQYAKAVDECIFGEQSNDDLSPVLQGYIPTIMNKHGMPEIEADAITETAYYFYSLGAKKRAEDKKPKELEWSEEDEKIRSSIINFIRYELNHKAYIGTAGVDSARQIEWLKSLSPQKQCSIDGQELQKNLDTIFKAIDKAKEELRKGNNGAALEALCIQYPGIPIQKQWKPSDEQIEALADALSLAKNCGEESAFDLRTLYEQLKKL